MSEDLISRQETIYAVNKAFDRETLLTGFVRSIAVRALRDVPSAEPHWIPVSERLPEDKGWYLVTDDSGGVRWLEVEHYDPESGLEPFCTVQNPVAWMPLPEPFKEGEQE